MADFALGWVGIDFAGDDGRKFGLWPWQTDEASREPPAPQTRDRPREERRRQASETARQERKPATPARPEERDKRAPPHLDPRLQGLP